MLTPFLCSIGLIATSFMAFLPNWPDFVGARLILAGVALFLAIRRLSENEVAHLFKTAQFPLILSALPAIWIIVQFLPTPIFENSVWESARSVLGPSLRGHISADIPSTERALAHLSLWITTMLLAAALTIDRFHAELGLAMLTVWAGLQGLLSNFTLGGDANAVADGTKALILDSAAIGLLCSLAGAVLVFERYETRGARQPNALRRLCVLEGACFLAFVICAWAILKMPDAMTYIAACGVSVFVLIIAIRRLGLGFMMGGALALGLLIATSMIAAFLNKSGESVLLAFSPSISSLLEQTRRMIQDAPLVGTGAGTFAILDGLYRGTADPPVTNGPTLAAVWIIELGAPMVWMLAAIAVTNLAVLVSGALTRGRDSAYPILGSALVVTMTMSAFVNTGFASPNVSTLSSAALGLAMVQRLRRKTG